MVSVKLMKSSLGLLDVLLSSHVMSPIVGVRAQGARQGAVLFISSVKVQLGLFASVMVSVMVDGPDPAAISEKLVGPP